MLSRHSLGTHEGNELAHNSSVNTWPQLFQLPEPLWSDPGLKRVIVVRELVSTARK